MPSVVLWVLPSASAGLNKSKAPQVENVSRGRARLRRNDVDGTLILHTRRHWSPVDAAGLGGLNTFSAEFWDSSAICTGISPAKIGRFTHWAVGTNPQLAGL